MDNPMTVLPAMPASLVALSPAPIPLDPAASLIYKCGFPDNTPDATAAAAAVDRCRAACDADGYDVVGEPEVAVIRTPDHEAAGEYLIRVEAQRRQRPATA